MRSLNFPVLFATLSVGVLSNLAMASDLKVDSIEPKQGPITGDTLVHVKGSGFHEACEIRLGTDLCTDPKLVSPNDFYCRTPAVLAAANADVSVKCGTDEAVLKTSFLYFAPLTFNLVPKVVYIGEDFPLSVSGGEAPYHFSQRINGSSVDYCQVHADTGKTNCSYGASDMTFSVQDALGNEATFHSPVVNHLHCSADSYAGPGTYNKLSCDNGVAPFHYLVSQGEGEIVQEQNDNYLHAGLSPGKTAVVIEDSLGEKVSLDFVIPHSGYLDPAWGRNGYRSVYNDQVPLLASWNGMAVLGVSKPGYGPGWPEVWRVRADGTLDPDFGTGGIATPDTLDPATAITAIAVKGDGSVVLAGWTYWSVFLAGGNEIRLVRLTSDGKRDSSFGTKNGETRIRIRNDNSADSIAFRPDGGAWIGVSTCKDGTYNSGCQAFAVLIDSNGREIRADGKSGQTRILLSPDARNVSVASDGKNGTYAYFETSSGPAMSHLDSTGAFAKDFMPFPALQTPWVSGCAIGAMSVSQDRIFASWSCPDGRWNSDESRVLGVMLQRQDGSVDATFGSHGLFPNEGGEFLVSKNSWVQFQEDGQLLVSLNQRTHYVDHGSYSKGTARFSSDGKLDVEFGANGRMLGGFDEGPIALDGRGGFFLANPSGIARGLE